MTFSDFVFKQIIVIMFNMACHPGNNPKQCSFYILCGYSILHNRTCRDVGYMLIISRRTLICSKHVSRNCIDVVYLVCFYIVFRSKLFKINQMLRSNFCYTHCLSFNANIIFQQWNHVHKMGHKMSWLCNCKGPVVI